MGRTWKNFVDIVLVDKDLADIKNVALSTSEGRIGLAIRAVPRLTSIAASAVATIGTLLLLLHYAFIVRALPTTDVPTLLKLAGVAMFGTLLAALAFTTLTLPGYLCGHWRAHGSAATHSRLPRRLGIAIFGLAFLGDMLAAFVPGLDQWARVALMGVPPYLPVLGLLLTRRGRAVLADHRWGLFAGPLVWFSGSFIYLVGLVGDVHTHDPNFKTVPWTAALFVMLLLLFAVLNAAIAYVERSRVLFGFLIGLSAVVIIDPQLLSNAPFHIFRLGDYDAAVQFRDEKTARMMHARCQLRYSVLNKDGILHIVDASGPSIMYTCTRLGVTRTGFLDPKEVLLTVVDPKTK